MLRNCPFLVYPAHRLWRWMVYFALYRKGLNLRKESSPDFFIREEGVSPTLSSDNLAIRAVSPGKQPNNKATNQPNGIYFLRQGFFAEKFSLVCDLLGRCEKSV